MKVLMTGATGFVGGRAARRLVQDMEVRAAVRQPSTALDELGVKQVQFTLEELDASLLDGVDVVVHTAATTMNDLDAARMINRVATRRLVDLALETGVSRFVYVSTTAVYDKQAVGDAVISEDAPLAEAGRVSRVYSVTKAESEAEVERGREQGLSTAILRPSAVLGAGPTSTWGARFPREWRAGTPRPLHPEETRGWIHVDDLAEGIALAAGGTAQVTANMVADHTLMANYIDGIRDMLGDVGDLPRPAGEPWRGTFAATRMREDLGCVPSRSFEQAMDEIAAYWADVDPSADRPERRATGCPTLRKGTRPMSTSPPSARTIDDQLGITVRLSSNESPFGPSPAAMRAAREALEDAHFYPDDTSGSLREALGSADGVPVDRVAVAAGSTPLLLDLIALATLDGGELVTFDKSFVAYTVGAVNARVRHVQAPVGGPATLDTAGYVRDPEALLDLVTPKTRVVIIDHPGNPSGAHLTGEELRALVERLPENLMVVIDEAYHHFGHGQAGYATAAELGLEHPGLVITRTFSKAHALAGLRAGYLVGPSGFVTGLEARRPRFNISTISQAAAIASLADTENVQRVVEGTIDGRHRLASGLRQLGIACTESLGNFVTVELGTPATPIVDAYRRVGIGVRPLEPYGMTEQIRVTVGKPSQIDIFLEASTTILAPVAASA